MQGIDHYENFPVASWLCPPRLRPPILALYGFARTADDLADEGEASAAERLADLQAFRDILCIGWDHERSVWRAEGAMAPRWPEVFTPLWPQLRAFNTPLAPLLDLLDAFMQDARETGPQHGFADRDALLDYCRRSANPVGRLLLHFWGVRDERSLAQSDAICSALQLINFWQDRARDLARERDYLPRTETWTSALAWARALMHEGAPLARRVPGRAGWELRLVVQGGLHILGQLEASAPGLGERPLAPPRPKLGARDVPLLVWRALWWHPR